VIRLWKWELSEETNKKKKKKTTPTKTKKSNDDEKKTTQTKTDKKTTTTTSADDDDEAEGSTLKVATELKVSGQASAVVDASWCVADDNVIVAAYANKTCRVWNAKTGVTLKTLQLERPGYNFRSCRFVNSSCVSVPSSS